MLAGLREHLEATCAKALTATLVILNSPHMASHDVSWVLGAHVCFGSFDFIIAMEGELARAPAPVQLPCSTNLDATGEAFEKL